jgi:branched-chain amino acid transport system substrate-binding protein
MELRVRRLLAGGLGLAVAAFVVIVMTASGAAAASKKPVTYTIGVLQPLTGALGIYGVPAKNGATVAARYVNQKHLLGSNVKLALNIADDQSTPATAISAYQNQASSKDVGIICCDVSTIGTPLKPVAIGAKVPTVIDGASAPALTQLPYVYRTIFDPSQPGSLYDETIDGAAKFWHPKTAVVVYSSDSSAYAGPVQQTWVNELQKDNIQVLGQIATLTTDTNFSGPATQIESMKPDLVVANTLSNATANLIRSLRQFGYNGHIVSSYGVDSPAVFSIGGTAMAGVTFAATFSPLSSRPESKLFTGLFEKDDGSIPTLYTAEGWNSVMFLVQGIKAAEAKGTVTRASLATALSKIKTFNSTNGQYTLKGGDSYYTGKPLFLQWTASGTESLTWTGK